MGKLEPNFFGLSCYVFDGLAAIYPDDLVLVLILEDFKESVDQIHGEVPLIYFLINLGRPIEKQLSKGSHGFSSHFLTLVFNRIEKSSDDSKLEDISLNDSGVPNEEA